MELVCGVWPPDRRVGGLRAAMRHSAIHGFAAQRTVPIHRRLDGCIRAKRCVITLGLMAFASLFPIVSVLGYAQLTEWLPRRQKREGDGNEP